MKYSSEQYKTLSERFNKQSFTGKLIIIKNNPNLFEIEVDDYNLRLRLLDEDAMKEGIDRRFSFPEFITFEVMRDLFKLVDINNIKELK